MSREKQTRRIIQVATRINELIFYKVYLLGDKIPSVNQFALKYNYNAKDVSLAYELLASKGVLSLESDGYVVSETFR